MYQVAMIYLLQCKPLKYQTSKNGNHLYELQWFFTNPFLISKYSNIAASLNKTMMEPGSHCMITDTLTKAFS